MVRMTAVVTGVGWQWHTQNAVINWDFKCCDLQTLIRDVRHRVCSGARPCSQHEARYALLLRLLKHLCHAENLAERLQMCTERESTL